MQKLAGRYTLGEFCELIDGLDLFPVEPDATSRACTAVGRSIVRRSIWRCARPGGRCMGPSAASRGR